MALELSVTSTLSATSCWLIPTSAGQRAVHVELYRGRIGDLENVGIDDAWHFAQVRENLAGVGIVRPARAGRSRGCRSGPAARSSATWFTMSAG